jgi:hypothetical protein
MRAVEGLLEGKGAQGRGVFHVGSGHLEPVLLLGSADRTLQDGVGLSPVS